MATFIPQVSDQFPQQQLFTPDYNFLMQGYAQKQAQYDRGFSAVRNMYSSLLNANVSNAQNADHRNKVFKAIESQIKSISGLDLSDSTTASKALTTFDPLVNDQDLMHDMSVTSAISREMQLSERQRTSTDPKVREGYNPLSVEDLNYVIQDLSMANRGDGSIQEVSPRKYINYIDLNDYLHKTATEEGLKITKSGTQGGYILTKTNGEGAIPDFTQWAASRLSGAQHQEQLQLMGRVNARRQINSIMGASGVSKNDARALIATGIQGQILQEKAGELIRFKSQADSVQQSLDILRKKNNAKGLSQNEIAVVEQLKAQSEMYSQHIKGVEKEISELEEGDIQYLANNLEGIYAQRAMQNIATSFAQSYARTHVAEEIKADDVVLTKWRINEQIQDRMSRERIALMTQDRLDARQMNQQKFDMTLKMMELTPQGQQIGYSTPQEQNLTGFDVMYATLSESMDSTFEAAFSARGLLGNIPGVSQSTYYPTLIKIKDMSDGQMKNLTEQDLINIQQLGEKFNVNTFTPESRADAHTLIKNLLVGLKGYSEQAIKNDFSDDKDKNAVKISAHIKNVMQGVYQQVGFIENAEQELTEISNLITDNQGKLKEGYEAATLMGYNSQGQPLYDISNVEFALRDQLSQKLPSQYRDSSILTTRVNNYTNVSPDVMKSIFSGNIASRVIINGEDATEDYVAQSGSEVLESIQNANGESLQKLLGSSVVTKHDPIRKNTVFEFSVDPSSDMAKSLPNVKGKEFKLQVTVPMSSLNVPALSTFARDAANNLPEYQALGVTSTLYDNPNSTFKLPDYLRFSGYDIEVSGQMGPRNRNYSVKIEGTVKGPNGTVNPIEQVIDVPLGDNGKPDKAALLRIEKGLSDLVTKNSEYISGAVNNPNQPLTKIQF